MIGNIYKKTFQDPHNACILAYMLVATYLSVAFGKKNFLSHMVQFKFVHAQLAGGAKFKIDPLPRGKAKL